MLIDQAYNLESFYGEKMKQIFKKRFVAICAIGVLFLLTFFATAPIKVYGEITNASPWYTVHSNKQKTKCADVRGVFDPVELFHLLDGSHDDAVGISVIGDASTFSDDIARYYRLVSIGRTNYLQVINTQIGEVEYTLDNINWGARFTAPTVLSNGNIVVSDYGRVRVYTPDLKRRVWSRRFHDIDPQNSSEVPMLNMPMYGADELPDGRLLVPNGGGKIYIFGPQFGKVISRFDLDFLGIKIDPITKTYLRCGPAFDGNLVFFVVYEEILLLEYISGIRLVLRDRYHYGDTQLSSTTPCIDKEGKRVFFSSVPYDSPETPAFQYALNYDNKTFTFRWSYSGPEVQPVDPNIPDQLSNSYNEDTGLIIFNRARGVSTAFIEENCGDNFCPKIVWQTPHRRNFLTAIAGKDNIVYSTDTGNLILCALNGDTGKPIWALPIRPGWSRKPMIAADDVIYYDYPGGLLAIGQKGIRAPSLAKKTKSFFVQRELTPNHAALLPNYPNPFNPETWLPFQLAKDAIVTISIYNTKGELIRTLCLGNRPAGVYATKDKSAYWDGEDCSGEKVASGVYFYTLQAGNFAVTRRMIITK